MAIGQGIKDSQEKRANEIIVEHGGVKVDIQALEDENIKKRPTKKKKKKSSSMGM